MLSNMPRKLFVGFGSLIVLLACLGCASEAKKGRVANQIQVIASVQDITATFYEARIAAAAHAATGDPTYARIVEIYVDSIYDACNSVLDIIVNPENRELIMQIQRDVNEFGRLDDALAALNQELRERRVERVIATNGIFDSLMRVQEIVRSAATASAREIEVNGMYVEYVHLDRLRAMDRIAFIQRHVGLARVAAMNFETALEQNDRNRFWVILESELMAMDVEIGELENYIVSPQGRQAITDLRRFTADWKQASDAIGGIITRRATNSAEVERLSTHITDKLAGIRATAVRGTLTLVKAP